MNRTHAFRVKPFDADEWQKLYYRNQQQYIRQRWTTIKLLYEGQSRIRGLGCIGTQSNAKAAILSQQGFQAPRSAYF